MKSKLFTKMLVRNGAIFLVLVLVLSFLLAGCSSPQVTTVTSTTTQATTTTSAVTTTMTTTTAQLQIKLKFYTNFPPTGGPNKEAQILADIISKKTNGRVEITVYPAEQLGPNSAVLDLLKNGITDMAALGLPPFPTLFPLENGQELPLAVIPEWANAMNVRNQLSLGDYGQAFTKNNLKFLSWNIQRPMQLFLTKKVSKAEDFKGLKVRSANPSFLQPFTEFGITPVAMPLGQVYESLQRGVIDAVVNAPEQCVASKWYEVTKFYCTQNLGYGSTAMVMSKGVWDNLPSDIRAAFSQAIPEWLPQAVAFYKDIEVQAVTTMKANNVEVYALPPSEAARWIQLKAPVVDAWVAKTEAPGVPAKAMVEAIRKSAPK